METVKIIIMILTALVTLPFALFSILYEVAMIYRDIRRRPGAKPLTKDEWKIM